MRNVYSILTGSVAAFLLLFCQMASAHSVKHGFIPVSADTLVSDTPRIISFTPTSGRQGTAVAIFGTNFTGTTAVYFGNTKALGISVWGDTAIYALVGAGSTGAVTVINPRGNASKPGFVYRDSVPPLCDTPRIISFSPTSARKGNIVNIFGVRFINATSVRFGGVLADSIWVLSDSTIRAKVGTGATGSVSVTTPCGTASRPGFTFIRDTVPPLCDTPRVISFTPASARRGEVVTISGARFINATAVRFGGVLADSIIIYSDSIIKAFVGNGASGAISVATPCGTTSKPGFTFIRDTIIHDSIPPHIYSFFPTHAKNGDSVYIRGHNFLFVNSVKFGGVPARRFLVHSDTLIRAVVNNGASGAVAVSSAIGLSAKNGFVFIPDSTGTPDSLARMTTVTTADATFFVVYPNPASGYAIWKQPATDHISSLQLMDMNGRLVRTISLGKNAVQTNIPINSLTTGMYKLVWSDGKSKVTKSLLIK